MSQEKQLQRAAQKIETGIEEYLVARGLGPRMAGDWFVVVNSHRLTEQREPGSRYDMICSPMQPHALTGLADRGMEIIDTEVGPVEPS